MSKVDALRAMREAKYARNGAAPAAGGAATSRVARPAVRPATTTKASPPVPAPDAGELCGHRNMGGKSCSRPSGHSEKNHRYASA